LIDWLINSSFIDFLIDLKINMKVKQLIFIHSFIVNYAKGSTQMIRKYW